MAKIEGDYRYFRKVINTLLSLGAVAVLSVGCDSKPTLQVNLLCTSSGAKEIPTLEVVAKSLRVGQSIVVRIMDEGMLFDTARRDFVNRDAVFRTTLDVSLLQGQRISLDLFETPVDHPSRAYLGGRPILSKVLTIPQNLCSRDRL